MCIAIKGSQPHNTESFRIYQKVLKLLARPLLLAYFKSLSSYWLKGFPVLHSSLLKGHTGNSTLVENSTVQIRKTIFDQCEDTGLTCGFNSYW
jgi:hypothetical protein